jgi:hypothetical protein
MNPEGPDSGPSPAGGLRGQGCVESCRNGALEIYGRFVAQNACADGAAKIVIGLKFGLHLLRAPGMKLLPRGNEALAQVLGKGCRVAPRGIETLLLPHSISVNSRSVFEVERDRAEYLRQSQSLEFSQDRFGRKSFIEALDDGIERYASTGQIVTTVALFDVFFRHQPDYSWTLPAE